MDQKRNDLEGKALTKLLACDMAWAQVWLLTLDYSTWTDEALELVASGKVRRLEWWPRPRHPLSVPVGAVVLCHDEGETSLQVDGEHLSSDVANKLAQTMNLGAFAEESADFKAAGISQERHRYLRLCEQHEVLRKLDIMLRGSGVFNHEDIAQLAEIADEEEFGYYDFFNAINQQVNPELYEVKEKGDAQKSS
jgi:hypothetical protein